MPPMRSSAAAPHQHRPARRGGDAAVRVVHPRERIQQREEIDERRHQRRARPALSQFSTTISLTRSAPVRSACAISVARCVGFVHDVGIGQQQPRLVRRGNALLHRPQLAGPARGAGRAGDHRSRRAGSAARSRRWRRCCRHPPARCAAAPVILRQQRADAASITSASSRAGTTAATGGHPQPAALAPAPGRSARSGRGTAADTPRPARQRARRSRCLLHASPRNQATASRTAARAGRGA